MNIEKVYEFSTGKNDWNTIEIGLHEGNIVVRDEVGMIEFDENAIDQLMNGIDQARRRLRENQRMPTRQASDEDASEESADEEEDNTEDSDDEDTVEGTGLGPQFPG